MSKKLSWLDELKLKFPTMKLSAGTPTAANANREPRQAVLALIENSIAVLNDSQYQISKRGKTYTPETCFTLQGEQAEVMLKYCREKLTLPDGNKAMTVPTTALAALLAALKDVVESNEFDAELESIKARRVAAQKGAASTNTTAPKKKAA